MNGGPRRLKARYYFVEVCCHRRRSGRPKQIEMKEEDGTEAEEGSKRNIRFSLRFFVVTAGQSDSRRQKWLLREISIWKKGVAVAVL